MIQHHSSEMNRKRTFSLGGVIMVHLHSPRIHGFGTEFTYCALYIADAKTTKMGCRCSNQPKDTHNGIDILQGPDMKSGGLKQPLHSTLHNTISQDRTPATEMEYCSHAELLI